MLLFAEGFEHYGTTPNGGRDNMLSGMWAEFIVVGGISISATQVRTGTKSLVFTPEVTGSAQTARFTLGGSPKITCGVGVGLFMVSLPAGNSRIGMQFRDISNAPILTLCCQSDGSIAVRKGAVGGPVIDISDAVLTAGNFSHIETKVTFDDVVGYVEVRVNGVVVIALGSLDLGVAGAAQVSLNGLGGVVPVFYWDDIVAWDDTGSYCNDFLGAQRVLTIYPTGDTAQADFVLHGAGTGFGCINQTAPDGDTTYLSSDTVSDKSDFSLPTLPPELAFISGVFVPAMAKLDAAGVGNLLVSMISAATDLPGNDSPLTTNYTYYRNAFEYDPNTSAPWTKTGLEAALVRLEKSL